MQAEELQADVKTGYLPSESVGSLISNVLREMQLQFFVGVQPDRVEMYTDSRKGWEAVLLKFPSAIDDIEEMNKCFALCRYAAAVFHSLLVVEHGLVELGKLIGVTDPKEGWDASCKKLKSIVDAGRAQNTTGINFEFLDQINVCIQSMKLAWRNKVNHATGKPVVLSGFPPHVAEDIIAASRTFMRRLVEGI